MKDLPRLPFAFARRHGALVTGSDGTRLRLALIEDASPLVLLEARRYLRQPLAIEHVSQDAFDRLLQSAYEHNNESASDMVQTLGEDLRLDEVALQLKKPNDLLEGNDDAPIIRLINALLSEAIRAGASDIHIEPFEGRLAVRLRVDGVMRKVLEPPRVLAPLIVSRVKVMARLDIAEKRLPQDGRISVRIANRPVDVRVSTLPCGHGERVVMRLLDKQTGRLQLEDLGMDSATVAQMDALVRRPHGILLVTGPTGSGKTTTLYAALSRINDHSRNIMTVEDPIEYDLDGIAQSQVNTKVDMSFARGLRAILRQDPDVVMVGEIRDLETAQIAIQASLTGHLVLSTLHTNSAIGAVTRLRDMGTEPFLMASSLIGVLAQRLVRLLCKQCKRPQELATAEMELLNLRPLGPREIFRADGCPACNYTGYRGRTVVTELVPVDDTLRRMIHDGAAEQALEEAALRDCPSLVESGRRKILAGLTTTEEVLRVMRDA